MESIIVKQPIGNLPARKVKSGWSVPTNPFMRYRISLLDPSTIIPVGFDKDSFFKKCLEETTEWYNGINAWAQARNEEAKELVVNENLTLSDYQTRGLKMLFSLDRALLLMEQGTGKTPLTMASIFYRRTSTLIVCPNNARAEWALMFQKFFPELKFQIIDDKEEFDLDPNVIYIMGYARMIRIQRKHTWDTIIFDEVHKLKSYTGKSHKVAYHLSSKAKYVYGLTGTVYGNDLMDVFGVAEVVEERLYGTDKKYFQQLYFDFIKKKTSNGEYTVFRGYKNLETFKTLLNWVSYRVELDDVVALKKPRELNLWVTKPKEYNELKNDLVIEVGVDDHSVVQRKLNLTAKLQQICSGFTHGEQDWYITNRNKITAFMEWAEDNKEQAVIFLTYDLSEQMIYEEFNKRKITYSSVSKFSKDPEKAKSDFKSGEVQYIIIKYSSGTEGMNFQNARIMIFYDITQSHIDYSQALTRIYRRGQEHECLYVYMLTENSVEQKVLSTVKGHRDFSEYLYDGGEL